MTETAERFSLPAPADAALFCAVHDVLMSRAALDNVFAQLRPGAWVVAGGGKWPAAWNVPLTAFVAALHAPYVRDLVGFDRPWRVLEQYVDDLAGHGGRVRCGLPGGRSRAGRTVAARLLRSTFQLIDMPSGHDRDKGPRLIAPGRYRTGRVADPAGGDPARDHHRAGCGGHQAMAGRSQVRATLGAARRVRCPTTTARAVGPA